jgi:predicted small lipoprotein YifL
MIKIMKRKVRSLAFLLLITVAGIGLSGALSFAAPAAGQANNNKTGTKAPQRDGTSPTKRPSTECARNCRTDYKTCLSQAPRMTGIFGDMYADSCKRDFAGCMDACASSLSGQDKPAKRIKARPRTWRPPTP